MLSVLFLNSAPVDFLMSASLNHGLYARDQHSFVFFKAYHLNLIVEFIFKSSRCVELSYLVCICRPYYEALLALVLKYMGVLLGDGTNITQIEFSFFSYFIICILGLIYFILLRFLNKFEPPDKIYTGIINLIY